MLRFLVFILFLVSSFLSAKIIKINTGNEQNTIASAIKNASDYDTIIVSRGRYTESNLIISKKLRMIGVNDPVIDAAKGGSIFHVRSSGVTIRGFVLINTTVSYTVENSAIKIENADSCRIENNQFKNNFFGIYLLGAANCLIKGNRFVSYGKSEAGSGNGIHLWKCRNITIEGNRIQGHRDGIYLEFAQNCLVKDNYSSDNRRYGMHFMFSNSCTYEHNTFSGNSAGVAVMFTRYVNMHNNRFENNWGTGSYGLLLKEIYNSTISGNTFNNNSVGLYSEGSNKIIIENNIFIKNGWAVRLMANSMDNVFRNNDFLMNTFEISTNSTQNFNNFDDNYWSQYKGYDLNKDGKGDIPHHPVSLYSILVEKNSTALLLLRSFLVEILNYSEKVFPILTPEKLVDNSPSMSRIN